MSVALLDVNVLLALLIEDHAFHATATEWFAKQCKSGWATCPLTETGFVRIAAQTATAGWTVRHALRVIEENRGAAGHVFWPLDYSMSEILPEIRARIHGPKQLTDAVLLDLAIRRGGVLATFDQKVRGMFPEVSAHRERIVVLGGLIHDTRGI